MSWRRKKIGQAVEQQRLFMENGSILQEELIKCCDGKTNPITNFSADQILKATNNFNQSNLVGKDDCNYHFYRGTLDDDDNRLVVIKKKAYGGSHVRKICRDLSISSMVSGHKNFLKLLGCCLEFTCPFLVCEYAKGITESAHHQIDQTLPWNIRIKIAREILNSLAYLHTAFSTTFIHKSVHPRNVFLDVKGVAKLGDFRNCIMIPQGESFVREYKLEGRYGYLEPNYMSKGMITENVDVYSFGVFMLVLLSRRTPGQDDELHPEFLTQLVEDGRFTEIIDPILLENEGDVAEQELSRMQDFFLLSLKCIGVRGEAPEMMQVSKELKRIERS